MTSRHFMITSFYDQPYASATDCPSLNYGCAIATSEIGRKHVNSRSRSLYAIARPSVCRLSVTFVHPYSGNWNFRQCLYAIWYLSIKILRRLFQGKPLRRGS